MKIHNRIIEEANKSINSRERKAIFAQQVLNAMPQGEPIRATEIALKISEKDRFVTVQKVTAALYWLCAYAGLVERKIYTRGAVYAWEAECTVKLPPSFEPLERHSLFERSTRYTAFIKK